MIYLNKKSKILIILTIFLSFSFVYAKERVYLDRCVDGDTAIFKDKLGIIYTTRFLAVDTPETKKPNHEIEYMGPEASEYTCKRLKEAKTIYLEDELNCEKYDKYERRLSWVFVDNSLLQKELIEKGLAEVKYEKKSFKYYNELKAAEKTAVDNELGIWNDQKRKDFKVKKEKEESIKSSLNFLNSLVKSLNKLVKNLKSLFKNISSFVK